MPTVILSRVRLALFMVCCAALGISVCASEAPAPVEGGVEAAEAVPVKRVFLTPDKVAAELERTKRGVLIQLPRDEFEARLARANQAAAAVQTPPRLIRASYKARLEGTALVSTTDAEWQLIHTATAAGILPIDSFNLALQQLRWADGPPPIWGSLGAKGLGLVVERPGEHTLYFSWSARGNLLPAGLHFDLRLPACAVATLELDLPRNRVPVLPPQGGLVAGPHEIAGQADRHLWRISFAGQSQLDLTLRSSDGQAPPLVLSRLTTRQELVPGQLLADFEFDLEVLHRPIDRLVCLCDPVLRPYEVSARQLDRWQLHLAKNAPNLLEVRLREPLQGEVRQALKVRCVASLPPDRTWTCPGIQLADAVPRGETIVLRVDPEIQLDDWQPGGFRPGESVPPDGTPARPTRPETVQQITLVATLEAGSNPRRPSARLKMQGAEYRLRQQSWWQVGPERNLLTSFFTYEVLRGRLFQLPLLLPPGFEVERLELSPRELLRHWTVYPDKGRSTLLVDLQRGLPSAMPAGPQLKVWLRANRPQRGPLPFPDLVPVAQRLQEGTALIPRLQEGGLAISVDPHYQAVLSSPAPPGFVPDGPLAQRANLPWGDQVPDYYYPYRRQALDGILRGQGVEGTLELRPRPVRLRARCASQVLLTSSQAAVVSRLELTPEGGAPDTIDLVTSAAVRGPWNWTVVAGSNQVRSVQALAAVEVAPYLAALAAGNPLQAAALLGKPPPPGTWWRLTLTRPLRERLELEVTLEVPFQGRPFAPGLAAAMIGSPGVFGALAWCAPSGPLAEAGNERRWEIPLFTLPGAESMDGEITLQVNGPESVRVESPGLREEPFSARRDAAGSDRARAEKENTRFFRYANPPVALTLHGRVPRVRPPENVAGQAVAEQAVLTVYVEPGGRLLHHYQFQVRDWRQRTLPIRLPPAATLLAARPDARPTQPSANGGVDPSTEPTIVFDVPVTASGVQSFEVVYATESPSWLLGARLVAPPPQLPVRTLSFRRSWRLPPGIVPLNPEHLQRLPGPEPRAALAWWSQLGFAADDWAPRQREQLAAALDRLRRERRAGERWSLGQGLERLALEQMSLVLDASALRDAGLTPASRLPSPATSVQAAAPGFDPLADLHPELIHVPCRAAAVLTTRRQLALWRAVTGRARIEVISTSLEQAVAEAVAHGHDEAGRFRTVADWLQDDSDGVLSLASIVPGLTALPPRAYGAADTGWSPLAGQPQDQLLIVRPQAITLLGLIIGAMLLVGAARLSHTPSRWRSVLLFLWLCAGALAVLWLPPGLRGLALWPTLAGVVVALVRYFRFVAREVTHAATPPRSAVPKAVGAGALAWLLVSTLAARALAPLPTTVYVLPGKDTPLAKQSVLAPPELLKQIDNLTVRGAPGLRGAVLLAAGYEGRVVADSAQFEATFRVHNFAPDEEITRLTLPLAGIQLQEALLDGAAAFPRAVRAPVEGYVLEVKGHGMHTVVLRFAVPVSGSVGERELRCTIPELAQSRLVLGLPSGTRFVDTPGGHGLQTIAGEPPQLQTDLGRTATLHVRWRPEEVPGRSPVVQVQESYYWEVKATAPRLLALIQYQVNHAAVTTFAIDLPRQLEVRAVDAEAASQGTASPPRLRDWSLTDAGPVRRLQLDFQAPVSGAVTVTLVLVPRQPFGPRAVLQFPAPLGSQATRGLVPYRVELTRSFLAYRLEGLDCSVVKGTAVKGIAREEVKDTFSRSLARPWWTARRETLEPPDGGFWSTPGGTPILELGLIAPPGWDQGRQELSWQVGPRQADLHARAQLSDLDGSQVLLEWEVPPRVVVASVSGPDVRYWSRREGTPRVQVWLQQPVRKTEVQLSGWVSRPPAGGERFDLPWLRLLGVRDQMTLLTLNAAEGLALAPERLENLQAAPGARSEERLSYTSERGPYGGTFRVSRATPAAEAYLLTFAEVHERALRFVAALDYQQHRGELKSLTLSLRHWDGEVQLHAPRVAHVRSSLEVRKQGPADFVLRSPSGAAPSLRTWTLELQPGTRGPYQLTLTGSLPLEAAGELLMPEVRVDAPGAPPVARWLALGRPDLLAEAPTGLQSVADPVSTLHRWPGIASRVRRAGGLAWQITGEVWRLRLRPLVSLTAEAPVRLVLTERTSAVPDGGRWLHQATYWLHHEAGSDLRIALPAGAALLPGLTINGSEAVALPSGQGSLWLRLPRQAGVRAVRLAWAFEPGRESLTHPNLESPRLEGLPEGPVVWTVHVPPGYQPEPEANASAAGQDLRRAAAQLALLDWLGPRCREAPAGPLSVQLSETRRRFDRLCRRAEVRLAVPSRTDTDIGPDGVSLGQWLTALQERCARLAREQEWEKVLKEAVRAGNQPRFQALVGGLTGSRLEAPGRPAYWHSENGQSPPLQLIPVQLAQTRETWLRSVLVVLILLAAWGLTRLPRMMAGPEQLALLGCLGLVVFGPDWRPLFLLLLLGWAVVRLVWLVRRGLALLPRAAPAPDAGNPTPA